VENFEKKYSSRARAGNLGSRIEGLTFSKIAPGPAPGVPAPAPTDTVNGQRRLARAFDFLPSRSSSSEREARPFVLLHERRETTPLRQKIAERPALADRMPCNVLRVLPGSRVTSCACFGTVKI